MKSFRHLWFYCFTLLLAAGLMSASTSSMIQVGDKAPDFTVAALEGDSISLHNYAGKVCIVHLWSPTCPHCREVNEDLPDVMAPYGKSNLAYIMVSIDVDTTPWRRVIQEDHLEFAIHGYDPFDGAAKTMVKYQAPGTPCINIVDEKGKLVGVDVSYLDVKKYLKKRFPPHG